MTTKKPAKPEALPRLGYPHVEALLETEDFARLNQSFAEAYKKLSDTLDNKSTSLKTQKEARAAMKAYELTTDLLKELLKLKYAIQKQAPKK